MGRRTFLGVVAVATASVSGCAEEREPAVVETSITLGATSSGDAETIIDEEEGELDGGEFLWWEFRLDAERDVEYRVDLVEGASVNVYVLEPDEYEIMAEEEAGFEAVPETVSEGVESSTNKTVTLPEGSYRLVVMNAAITPENA